MSVSLYYKFVEQPYVDSDGHRYFGAQVYNSLADRRTAEVRGAARHR